MSDYEPYTYNEAAQFFVWQKAMKTEFQDLDLNKTWDLIELPKGKKVVGCKWVYKVKRKADGSVERYKARLVVKGFTQRVGIDFNETYSPVVKLTTVCALVSVALKRKWKVFQLDVNNAFLHGDLDEDVYMRPPSGLVTSSPQIVCKLNKSLYGLKQSSRQWNKHFDEFMSRLKFERSAYDNCVYYKHLETHTSVYLLLYVDDILIASK